MQFAQANRTRSTQTPSLTFFNSLTRVADKNAPFANLYRNRRIVKFISAGAIFLVLAWHWQNVPTGLAERISARSDLLSVTAIALFLTIQVRARFPIEERLSISYVPPFRQHGKHSAISLGAEPFARNGGAGTRKPSQTLLIQQTLAIGSSANHNDVPYLTLAKAKNPTMDVHLSEEAGQLKSGRSDIYLDLGVGSMLLSYKNQCKGES